MSYELNELLFTNGDLRELLDAHFGRVQEFIDQIPETQFKASTDEEITDHVVGTFTVTPILLDEDAKTRDEPIQTKLDVSGRANYISFDNRPLLVDAVQVNIYIPYTGDDRLWTIRPHSLWTIGSRGNIDHVPEGESGQLQLVITEVSREASQVPNTLEEMLHPIRETLREQRAHIESRQRNLRAEVEGAVRHRREIMGTHEQMARSLAIPIRPRPGSSDIANLPLRKKIVRPLPDPRNLRPPEPGIASEDYQYILNVIRQAGCTFEAAPSTFSVHGEDGLRDILLAFLNTHLEGEATGETFRKRGKTDIRVEDQNRAAFVAECKIWHGKSEVEEALDQLDGYLTWRDAKSALILFNKDVASFKGLQTKLPDAVRAHKTFRHEITINNLGEWRFALSASEDPEREMVLHLFLFNLFVASSSGLTIS
jgi:hypothetical protein